MRRREFIALSSAAVVAGPMTAIAQQKTVPVIGFLSGASPNAYLSRVRAFQQGLKETGYVEGQNVVVEYHWAEGDYKKLPALAADLIRRQVSIIVANTPAAVAAKAATTTIPIVFDSGTDPVKIGLVASLSRPGGNVTGVSNLNSELLPKRMGLVRELLPKATVIGLLVNPENPGTKTMSEDMQTAARTVGLEPQVLHASTERDFEAAFAKLTQLHASALLIASDPFFFAQSARLGSLTLHHSVPAIFQYHEFAAAGGLISYAGHPTEPYRLMGIYAGRILNGEKPADLPDQQSTQMELIINTRTAKALGLTVPPKLLFTADEVIE